MLKQSQAYRDAITGDTRKIQIRAVLDISDPDITYQTTVSSPAAGWSKGAQIHDKTFERHPYATLERGRWRLDGTFDLLPAQPETITEQVGFVGAALSREDGTFPVPTFVALHFRGVQLLQTCTICFSAAPYDGVAEDFTVEIRQGGKVYHRKQFVGNTAVRVTVEGFAVETPDTIQVTVKKWSLPGRRMRLMEIIPGIWEEWTNDHLTAFACSQSADFSALSLPYGTCDLSLDNTDRRFDPRNPEGLYRSIQERQGIQLSLGVELADGAVDYKPLGMYYQYADGWQTADSGMSLQWHLADLVGLLSKRKFLPPQTLPTALKGWIECLVAQLGINFQRRCHVDPDYAYKAVTVHDRADVSDATCGAILRWVCMATGTFARSASDGRLTVEPHWSEGCVYTLDNLTEYPAMSSNGALDAIIFTIFDGQNSKLAVSGTSISSGKTVSVKNPFIHTAAEARTAARQILTQYGGTQLALVGRGDPASEIGDVATVELDSSHATTGRVMLQTFAIQRGVLQDCKTQLLQASGAMLYSRRVVMTTSGVWIAPAGVTQIRVILVGHGSTGTDGADGTWDDVGQDGVDGQGGKIWHATLPVNPNTTFGIRIGADAELENWSSASGHVYPYGFTDIDSGDSFGRSGVMEPVPGSGDGGAGGTGGTRGIKRHHRETEIIEAYPGKGTPGAAGASGCVVIYYEQPEKEREQWPLTFNL